MCEVAGCARTVALGPFRVTQGDWQTNVVGGRGQHCACESKEIGLARERATQSQLSLTDPSQECTLEEICHSLVPAKISTPLIA